MKAHPMNLSKDQISLLLYLETRAVDHAGRVDGSHMNAKDFSQAELWKSEGFIEFGRIASGDTKKSGAHWVRLSNDAWAIVAAERRASADRNWSVKAFRTTAEKLSD
jgi:hypothetical protein